MSSRPYREPLSLITVLRWLLAFTLLNAPFWLWGQASYISRPWFNLELVLPLLAKSLSSGLGLIVLVVTWVVDVAVSQSHTFYFTSPIEFINSARFLGHLSLIEFFTRERIVVVLPFLVAAIATLWLIRPGFDKRGRWVGLLLPFVLAGLDVANGSSMASHRDARIFDFNLAGSPTVTLVARARLHQDVTTLGPLPAAATSRPLADLEAWALAHPKRSMILVLAESMGVHQDGRVVSWLRAQLWDDALQSRYALHAGEVPFYGSTTNGELRELCTMSGSYRVLIKTGTSQDCLPARLAQHGWMTTGLHGFSGAMFDRDRWWPMLGLRHQEFGESLVRAAQGRECGGAFAGACDSDVLRRAFEIAAQPRQFVYVVTLNSHLPIKTEPLALELTTLCKDADVGAAECQYLNAIGRMLRAVHNGLSASTSGQEPMVLVVGDHAPPFSDRASRGHFSQANVLAYALVPRH